MMKSRFSGLVVLPALRVDSLAERAVTGLLRVSVAAMAVGWASFILPIFSPFAYHSAVNTFIYIMHGGDPAVATAIDRVMAVTLIGIAAFLLVSRRAWVVLPIIAVWLLIERFAEMADGRSKWHVPLILTSGTARVLAPVILLMLLARPSSRTIPSPRLLAAEWTMRFAIAVTFAAHGIEALLRKAIFVDYLIFAGMRIGYRMPEETAVTMLKVIGTMDLLLAIGILLPWRLTPVAIWMAAWGFITAGARIVYAGQYGLPDFTLRIIHGALPLALALLWHFHTATPDTNPETAPATPPETAPAPAAL